MQSEEQKILKLIKSEDPENITLGNAALYQKLTKENAMYWYMTLDNSDIVTNVTRDKITEYIGFNSKSNVVEHVADIVKYMQDNKSNALVVNKFFQMYNNYLLGLITHTWTKDERIKLKKELNGEYISKSDEDL
jgi:hypothetical protein